MAKDARWTDAVRQLAAQAIDQEFDNGYLRIYEGDRPATPATAITDQTLLSEHRFSNPAADDVTDGVITFDAISAEDAALAEGQASFARALKADGTTAIVDLSVGASDANVVLASTTIPLGAEVSIESASVTVAAASAQ